MSNTELNIMTWNPRAGGFDTYQSTSPVPEREAEVMDFLGQAKTEHGLDAITIPDAFRWLGVYDGEEGIARQLGFDTARYVLMDDEKLNRDEGVHIGIAFATNKKIHDSETIDLGTRNALGIILDVGSDGLQVANVYLDHDDEARRLEQVKALVAHLRREVMPTIIIGDLNGLQSDITGSSFGTKSKDLLLRTIVACTPKRFLPQAVGELDERLAVPYIQANGFVNADPLNRPTFPSRLPMFEVDYIMHSADLTSSNTKVIKPKTSDHRAVVTNISL